MNIWLDSLRPYVIFRWDVFSWIVGILLAVGGIMLFFDKYTLAAICFAVSGVLFEGKVIYLLFDHPDRKRNKVFFAITMSVLITYLTVSSVAGTIRYGRDQANASAGFIQYESMKIILPTVGSRLRIDYTFANRGSRPVFDVMSWGIVLLVDSQTFSPEKMRAGLDPFLKFEYEHRGTETGGILGVGIANWNTAWSTSPGLLSQEQLDALKQGKLRVVFYAGGTWVDEQSRLHYWGECDWSDWQNAPNITIENTAWVQC